MSMFVGEALIGERNEISHIHLLIGKKNGPVGMAFGTELSHQKAGHSNLLNVLHPNLAVKPAIVMVMRVTLPKEKTQYLKKQLSGSTTSVLNIGHLKKSARSKRNKRRGPSHRMVH